MNEIVEIPLTLGKSVIVDAADFEFLSKWKWHLHPDGYAIRNAHAHEKVNGQSYNIRMHRILASAPKGMQVDHINGNKLDNRRCNLRICTKTENGRNRKPVKNTTSKYKGVCKPSKRYTSWVASIHVKGTKNHLGCYETEEAAARAYDKAAREHFGEFAWLNFPEEYSNVG